MGVKPSGPAAAERPSIPPNPPPCFFSHETPTRAALRKPLHEEISAEETGPETLEREKETKRGPPNPNERRARRAPADDPVLLLQTPRESATTSSPARTGTRTGRDRSRVEFGGHEVNRAAMFGKPLRERRSCVLRPRRFGNSEGWNVRIRPRHRSTKGPPKGA